MTKPLTDWYLRCPSCGGAAYWLKQPISLADELRHELLICVDGSACTDEFLTCGSCGSDNFGDYAPQGMSQFGYLDVRISAELAVPR